MIDRRATLGALAAMGAGLFPMGSRGQATSSFAGKQVRFVVAYSAGGVADVTARMALANLATALGAESVIIENKAGANGNIGTEYVARQPPNGLTYLIVPSSQITTNPWVPELRLKSIDVTTQLLPVAPLADTPLALIVPADSSITTIDQFIATARSASIRMGNPSTGTPQHLAALVFARANGLNLVHVPYKGGAPMISDIAGGHIDACISSISSAEPLVKAGKLRWIASIQSGPARPYRGIPSLLPRMKDAIVPSWSGIFAPAGTPAEAIIAVHNAVTSSTQTPATVVKLQEQGLEPMSMSTAEMQDKLRKEAEFMKEFLRGAKLEFTT